MDAEASRSTLRDSLVARLLRAEANRDPIEPISAGLADFDLEEAYAVQESLVAREIDAGAQRIGWKAGFTSRAMQVQMGVAEPNYGVLLDSMIVSGELMLAELIHPRVEPEIAFVLSEHLAGPHVGLQEALDATGWVTPCIEVVDSRFRDYRFTAADNTADNSSAARLVVSAARFEPYEFDLRLVGVVLERSGEVLETGAGAAALGHPGQSLAWLANKLASHGKKLSRGDIVITGGLTAAPFVNAGDEIVAHFDRLGPVGLKAV